LLTFAHLLANQSANYRRQSCCPEGGPHRRVTEILQFQSVRISAQGTTAIAAAFVIAVLLVTLRFRK
jgi:hypothetical protein